MQKLGWHEVEVWHCLFALSFFLSTHPLLSLNKGRSSRCRCPGLHQCSLTFPACALRVGERVTMGSICLLCTFARLLQWQHVTRGALIIRLPLLASGHSTSLGNEVNQRGPGPNPHRFTDSLDVVVNGGKREPQTGKQQVVFSFYSRCARLILFRC